MKRRGERLAKWGEGGLIAAALAVCLLVSLALYFVRRPAAEMLAPVHAVPAAVYRAEKINVNRDAADEIARLPGIGAVLAGRIVQYREENGGFASARDLLNVDGLGEGRLTAMLEYICFEE